MLLEMLWNYVLAAGISTVVESLLPFIIVLYSSLFQLTSISNVARDFILTVLSGKLLLNLADSDKMPFFSFPTQTC